MAEPTREHAIERGGRGAPTPHRRPLGSPAVRGPFRRAGGTPHPRRFRRRFRRPARGVPAGRSSGGRGGPFPRAPRRPSDRARWTVARRRADAGRGGLPGRRGGSGLEAAPFRARRVVAARAVSRASRPTPARSAPSRIPDAPRPRPEPVRATGSPRPDSRRGWHRNTGGGPAPMADRGGRGVREPNDRRRGRAVRGPLVGPRRTRGGRPLRRVAGPLPAGRPGPRRSPAVRGGGIPRARYDARGGARSAVGPRDRLGRVERPRSRVARAIRGSVRPVRATPRIPTGGGPGRSPTASRRSAAGGERPDGRRRRPRTATRAGLRGGPPPLESPVGMVRPVLAAVRARRDPDRRDRGGDGRG